MNPEKEVENVKKTTSADSDKIFIESSGMTDIIIVVQGKELYANQAVLMVSPVFRAMFESDFKEKNEKRVELREKTFDNVLLLLRLLYHKVEMRDLQAAEILSLLPLADEYQITFLIKDCGKHLLDLTSQHIPDIDSLFKLLDLAILYSLDDLRDKCVTYLMSYDCIEDTTMYKALSSEGKTLILESLVRQMRHDLVTHEDQYDRLNEQMEQLNRKMEQLQKIVHNHDRHCNCESNDCKHDRCPPLSWCSSSKVYKQYGSRCFENMGHDLSNEMME